LIYGEKKYQDFTPHEKAIVDSYQDYFLEESGGMVFPNTKCELEQEELKEMILKDTKFWGLVS
jgi:hypothetical protein